MMSYRLYLDQYQDFVDKSKKDPENQMLTRSIIGLTEEAGEVAGKYKKYLRDGKSKEWLFSEVLAELGDVMWYLTSIASELGTDLETIIEYNKLKISTRMDNNAISGEGDKR